MGLSRHRRVRRLAGPAQLGDFDWSQFGTQLATTVGASVAGAGTALLSKEIQNIGQPKQVIPQPAPGTTTIGGAAIPSTVLLYGGIGFALLLLIVVLKR